MPASSSERYLTLPRGLRVRLALGRDIEPLDAVVRAVGEENLTLGILDLPAEPSTLKGLHASIAAQLHGRLYELESSILEVETAPPGLVVTVPTEARQTQRRNFYRLNVSINTRAVWQETDPDGEVAPTVHQLTGALILDISGGGVQIRSREPAPIGALIALEFVLAPGTPAVRVAAKALTCRPEERTHAYRINTEFVGIARHTQEQIVRFIFQEQTKLSRRRSA